MDTLRFLVSEITEQGIPCKTDVAVNTIQPPGVEGIPLEMVSVSGRIMRVGEDFLFQGHIRGVFVHTCDRCLERAEAPFEAAVLWSFVEGAAATLTEAWGECEDAENADSSVRRFFQGPDIDLAPHVWEEVVLSAPVKYVCRDDCRGLCPHCGANLNYELCDCVREEAMLSNSGLAGLADLFPNLARKESKE